MNIIAFDTCLGGLSVAVFCADGRTAHKFEIRARGHAEYLLPMVDVALDEAGVALCEIDRIGVTIGPGTFTGTRVGVSAARAFVLAGGADVVGHSSLLPMGVAAARAAAQAEQADANIIVAMDARRGQLYVQQFGNDGAVISQPELTSAECVARRVQGVRSFIAGTGAQLVHQAAYDMFGKDTDLQLLAGSEFMQPDAKHLIAPTREASLSDVLPEPLYLRPADAKPQTGKSLTRAAP